MAQTATNVSAAKPPVAGSVSIGPTSATMPTDATTALSGFTSLGYLAEGGITNDNSPDVDIIKAFGGDPVLTLYTGKEDRFKFTLIEVLNIEVLKAVYGDSNVTGSLSSGITVKANNKEGSAKAFVFELIMRNNAVKRIVLPNAAVIEIGEIEYSDSAAIGYEVTVSAQADSSGNTHYEYIKGPTGGTNG